MYHFLSISGLHQERLYVASFPRYYYTVSHKKRSQLIFVRNFVKNQRILMHFSLLDLAMNDTRDGVNFTHLT